MMGSFSLFSATMVQRAVGVLYDVKYPGGVDPKLEFLWKPLGAFALLVSAFCFRGALVRDPSYEKFVLQALAGRFAMRAFIRLHHRELFYRAHQPKPWRNMANAAFNTALAVAILFYGYR